MSQDYLHGGWMVDGGFSYWPQVGPLGIRADLIYGLAQLSVSDVRLRPGSYGTGSYCGPFAFNCDSGYGGGTDDDYGVTKLGWNLGAGVEFPVYGGLT